MRLVTLGPCGDRSLPGTEDPKMPQPVPAKAPEPPKAPKVSEAPKGSEPVKRPAEEIETMEDRRSTGLVV